VIILCVLIFVIVAYPLYFVIIASISNADDVNAGRVIFLPSRISFYGFGEIFKDSRIWSGYKNTIIYSVGGTLINLLFTLPAAYTLSQKRFAPRKIIMPLFIFTMFFNGGMIPTYMLVRNLRLINTILVMMIPFCVSVYNLIIVRTFFESSIPVELYEAAVMDGCSHFRYFIRIVLPLSKAVISVIALYYFVGHWNDFFSPLLFLTKENLQPLQIILRNILMRNDLFRGTLGGAQVYAAQYADQVKYGVIIVASVPVVVFYTFAQKYLEKGVMIGAIKG
jgi:putative aldouronate transport system permease protein